jgi:hypothetical protein
MRKTERPSVRIVSIPAEIQTEHLPNTSLQCYLQINLFGVGFSSTLRWRQYVPQKGQLTSMRLHGVAFREIVFLDTSIIFQYHSVQMPGFVSEIPFP